MGKEGHDDNMGEKDNINELVLSLLQRSKRKKETCVNAGTGTSNTRERANIKYHCILTQTIQCSPLCSAVKDTAMRTGWTRIGEDKAVRSVLKRAT